MNNNNMKQRAAVAYKSAAERASIPNPDELKDMNTAMRIAMMRIDPRVRELANDAVVTTNSYSFEYHSPAQLQKLVSEVTPDYGLLIWPTDRRVEYIENIDARAMVTFTIFNLTAPDDKISFSVTGYGMGSGNNSDGKALTYASRRALMAIFGIAGGEDPAIADATASSMSILKAKSGQIVIPPIPPALDIAPAPPAPVPVVSASAPAVSVQAAAPVPAPIAPAPPAPTLTMSRGQVRQEAIRLYGLGRIPDEAAKTVDEMLRTADTADKVKAASEYLRASTKAV